MNVRHRIEEPLPDSVLLVVDHLEDQLLSSFTAGRVTVLPFGIVPSLYESRLRRPLEAVKGSVFPVEEVSDRALATMRRLYPRFADEVVRQPIGGGPSLLQLLDMGEGSVWWFTDTAEKSPLRSPFLNQLYGLAVIDEVLARGGWARVVISMADRTLGDCILCDLRARGVMVEVRPPTRPGFSPRGWLRRADPGSFWIRFLVLRLQWAVLALGNRTALAILGVRAAPREPAPLAVVFSRYPILYATPFTAEPRERNLAELFSHLRQRGPVWQAVLLSLWPWELLWRGQRIRGAFEKAHIVPLLLFNTVREILGALLGPSLVTSVWRCWRRRHALRVFFGRWDVTSLWRVELTRSLTNLELPNDLLLRQAMRRLARMYRPKVVIHPCEFQPMERAIWAGLKGTQTRSVAFQHATVSSNTLMYFFAEKEIETALAGKDPLVTPLPDYYLTTGDWPLEIMRAAGFPTMRSAVVGAVRYNGLRLERESNADKIGLRAHLGLPVEATLVLVATSSDWEDSLALLDALASAQALLPASFALLFKCHYHCRVEGEIRRLFSQVGRERWRIVDVDADLHAHIRASDIVLLTNSSTGLEAMALGRPPVVFDNRAVVNIGPLGDLREAALFAHTPLELAKCLQAALEPTVWARLETAWPVALARTFHKLDGQAPARFIAFLEERALL